MLKEGDKKGRDKRVVNKRGGINLFGNY